ncbi:hypothetical protein P4O66_001612 [Electrophorus voltai]|uniref:PDZ domain-containing protein 8 n=1 Tax=Electrophorus voltai TaxID=2609070 RepID=A0AAD8Z7I3_9TELE|nr:hypothetical protein P4O66_001612 [Electrophorus voltai]
MIYLILISAFCGAVVTLLLQLALLYRRSPERVGRTVQYVKAAPDPALKDYFSNPHPTESLQQQENTTATASRPQEATSPKQQDANALGTGGPRQPPFLNEPLQTTKAETCGFLNAIILFLFRELRDTPVVRHWITKKIRVEFEELLQTKTAGRLLEALSLRDISLGNSVPVFKTAKLMKPVAVNEDGMPEELNFEVDLEYNGGFHLAIDVDLVFGKSAYLFVKMTRVAGRLKLQFTRMPFTHWSFSFLEDPLIDFEVKSQFEGRPLPQLTSIIVNQLKRVIKRKHTLPNYKIRYKPFFPFQVQPTPASSCEPAFSIGDMRLVEGRLRVTLVECSRLFILGSYERKTYVHCTIELSRQEWREKPRSSIKTEAGKIGPPGNETACSDGQYPEPAIEPVGQYPEPAIEPVGQYPEPAIEPVSRYPEPAIEPVGRYPEPAIEPVGRYPEPAIEPVGRYPEPAIEPVGRYPEPAIEPVGRYPEPAIEPTEVIKGPNGSVGMTFRHVPASDGDVVHVSIETVTPSSPAAQADLQKGDRLIAIGGVKVTSSVQVLKLLKQAGDRVVVLYERPVRHQVPAMSLGPLPETLNPLEDPGYTPAGGYEEDPAHITTMDITDSKDNDSEFEELIMESKPAGASASVEAKDDSLLSINQSPKKTVANLASKPLGTISPILNRKLNLAGLQSPLKPQPKELPKPSPHKSAEPSEPPQRPTVPPPPPPARPPVPPRPHIKVTSASSESQNASEGNDSAVEKSPEKITPAASNGDKPTSEKMANKALEPKPINKLPEATDELLTVPVTSKQDSAKEKIVESASTRRDSVDEQNLWESAEVMFESKSASWSKSSVVFDVESNHKYLNVALWCKDPFKLGGLLCLGHISLHLEHIALECLSTSSAEYQSTFRLCAPEPRANVSRTALRSLNTHKGFSEKLCYGDVTLNFIYLEEGESDLSSGLTEREGSLHDEELKEREKDRDQAPAVTRDDLSYNPMQIGEVRHNFQDTQFQNPTWCEYCKKKEKCLAEHPFCLATNDRRSTDPEAKSTINRATTGLTRHIINTSSRLLNLRQVPKTRLAEQVPEPPGGGGTKLARKEGGLDDSVFIAQEIDQELEHNNSLMSEEREAADARRKALDLESEDMMGTEVYSSEALPRPLRDLQGCADPSAPSGAGAATLLMRCALKDDDSSFGFSRTNNVVRHRV